MFGSMKAAYMMQWDVDFTVLLLIFAVSLLLKLHWWAIKVFTWKVLWKLAKWKFCLASWGTICTRLCLLLWKTFKAKKKGIFSIELYIDLARMTIINTIQTLYNKPTARIKVNGYLSKSFSSGKGFKTGVCMVTITLCIIFGTTSSIYKTKWRNKRYYYSRDWT